MVDQSQESKQQKTMIIDWGAWYEQVVGGRKKILYEVTSMVTPHGNSLCLGDCVKQ